MAEEYGTIEDQGGYWEGTERRQNDSLRGESVVVRGSILRQSVVEVAESHGAELQAMRKRFPDAGAHDLIRFLRARDFDVAKSAAMFEANQEWRRANLPIPLESVRSTLETRKFYVLEHTDSVGRPVLYYNFSRFKDAPYVVEDEIRALVYTLEEVLGPMMGPSFETQQQTVLIDVSGIKSPPLQFLQEMNAVVEANYPERLFRTVMFPVPYWLQKIIQGCTTFVAEETRNKFAYVNDVGALEEFAMMAADNMGPDIADMVKSKQLKK